MNLLEQIVLCPISRVTGHLGTGTHTPVSAFTRTLLTIGQSNGTVYAVRALIAVLPALFLAQVATAQNTISFPTKDGGVVKQARLRARFLQQSNPGKFDRFR